MQFDQLRRREFISLLGGAAAVWSLAARAQQPQRTRLGIMRPAPRQKQPQISPIFISDKVTLHVSREKDGKLRLVYAAWDDHMVVQPDGCGQARRGEGRNLPPPTKRCPPLKKTKTPLRPPLVFSSYSCRSRASSRAFFALAFEVALPVTAPLVTRNAPKKVGSSSGGRRSPDH
jgi:hypothetical protein